MQGCLLFSCKDKIGITAELAQFFTDRQTNIVQYEQYTDAGKFFTRIAWDRNSQWNSVEDFIREFTPLQKKFSARCTAYFTDQVQTIGLLVSAEPHALIEIINQQESGAFGPTKISFILSNKPEHEEVALRHNIPFHYVPTTQDPAEYEAKQLEIINSYNPGLLGLARYMKVLTASFIETFNNPIINIHHSFLPSFVGAKPYEMAYERGLSLIHI